MHFKLFVPLEQYNLGPLKLKSFKVSMVLVWRLVQVIKAGEGADEDSRVCHAVLKARKAGCSEQIRLQPHGSFGSPVCESLESLGSLVTIDTNFKLPHCFHSLFWFRW